MKKGEVFTQLCPLVASIALLAACATDRSHSDAKATSTDRQTADQTETNGSKPPDTRASLAGTAWRLVEIVSMDDHRYAPADRALYTLEFNVDGSLRIRADCNLGTGSWTSQSAGLLQFGRIAATQAMCPPGSLHDRYVAQFPWVRSYVLKDGRLFLATMADGSIIEFEPMQAE